MCASCLFATYWVIFRILNEDLGWIVLNMLTMIFVIVILAQSC